MRKLKKRNARTILEAVEAVKEIACVLAIHSIGSVCMSNGTSKLATHNLRPELVCDIHVESRQRIVVEASRPKTTMVGINGKSTFDDRTFPCKGRWWAIHIYLQAMFSRFRQ